MRLGHRHHPTLAFPVRRAHFAGYSKIAHPYWIFKQGQNEGASCVYALKNNALRYLARRIKQNHPNRFFFYQTLQNRRANVRERDLEAENRYGGLHGKK